MICRRLLYFLIMLFFVGCGSAQKPQPESKKVSKDDENTIESFESKTADQKAREQGEYPPERQATIIFDPQKYDGMFDRSIGKSMHLKILKVTDNRTKGLDKHIGMLYALLYRIPTTKLYSTGPVPDAIETALVDLFSANGFKVKKVESTPSQGIVIKASVNELWVELQHSILGKVDIDLQVIDAKTSKVLWAGKIAKNSGVAAKRSAAYGAMFGMMGDGTELGPYLNSVLAEAIMEAWNEGGLKNAMMKIAERQVREKSLKNMAAKEPPIDDGKANLKTGISYYELGSYDKAAKYLQRALDVNPKWARAHYMLGMAYLKNGKRESAIEQYEALKNIDNNYAKQLFDNIYSEGD